MEHLFETVNPNEGEQNLTPEVEPEVKEPETQEPEEKPIDADSLMELPDEELKKYGIDDPKQWKSYQRLLHKKENEWQKRELEYQRMLQNLQSQFESKLNEFQQNLTQRLEPPKKEEPLVPPQKPRPEADGTIDPVEQARYAEELAEYNFKLLQKQREEFEAVRSLLEQERKAKEEAEKIAQAKSYVIQKLQEVGGLSQQEAMEALSVIMFKDENEYAKAVSDLYRLRKGKFNVPQKTKMNTPSPLGLEGGQPPNPADDATEFFNNMGKSKTREIFKTII